MEDASTKALICFIGVQITNVLALGVDYLLLKSGNKTITEYSVEYPVMVR